MWLGNKSHRLEVYKEVVSGRKELWDQCCRLRKEVKEAVREMRLSIRNDVTEKVNADFEGSRKEFWAFVGRRTNIVHDHYFNEEQSWNVSNQYAR